MCECRGFVCRVYFSTCVIRFCVFVSAAKSWLRFLVNEDGNGAHKLCMRKFYDNGKLWPVNQKCDVDIIIG